jgi:hypothetical protein
MMWFTQENTKVYIMLDQSLCPRFRLIGLVNPRTEGMLRQYAGE